MMIEKGECLKRILVFGIFFLAAAAAQLNECCFFYFKFVKFVLFLIKIILSN